jgi:hypothetical protein
MAKIHSYGVDNQAFRSTILGWMALATFVTIVLVDSLKKVLVDSLKSSDFLSLSSFDFSSLETSLSLLSVLLSAGLVPVTFSIISFIYGQFIWKINRLDKVPNLSGTWIGMGNNHLGVEPIRLELMQIEQNWQQILITVEVYKANHDQNFDATDVSSWLDEGSASDKIKKPELKVKRIGTEHSTIALITEREGKYSDFTFTYNHYGRVEGQGFFKGAMFLKYEEKERFHELEGDYINDKRGEDFNGLVGKILFRRISPELIETEEALQNVKDKDVLAHLHKVVKAQI